MAKYIDAEKVIAALTDTLQYEGMVMDELISVVANIPAADVVERKTGKWINAYPDIEPNPMFMYGVCSICGYEQSISDKLKFCPNCGARMNI